MKNVLLLLSCLASFHLSANMANPVIPGTLSGRPFVNQYVDVVHEDLFIQVDSNFKTADFRAVYHIKSSKDGVKIPFLFYAYGYSRDFVVKVDGALVEISEIPYEFAVPNHTKFDDFSYFFEPSDGRHSAKSTVSFRESERIGRSLTMSDFIYFETDISKGEHTIEVTYKAKRWIDESDWINEYSFRYALSPARYWKSFGTLSIVLDATKCDLPIGSNLGNPDTGSMDSIATWKFDSLPIDIAQWSYQPEKKPVVKKLTKIGPIGLALVTSIILAILHIIWIVRYRKLRSEKRYSPVLIIGAFLIPLIFVLCWMYYYDLIDFIIGKEAGGRHGYTFMVIIFYPVILLFYWMFAWLIDRDAKKRYQS